MTSFPLLPGHDCSRALAAIPPPTPQYRKPPLTAGRIVYLCYHAPRGALKKGVGKIFRGWSGKRRLLRALPGLQFPEPPASCQSPLRIHVLIGARYLPEACLLMHSLALAAGRPVEPCFYDDGTLTDDDCAMLRAKLPRASFRRIGEIEQKLDERLPADRFPCLRKLRPAYPHIRKLTDIHLFPGDDWKLVSDADILFFTQPVELLAHLNARTSCHMVDIAPAYGAPQADLETLAGLPVHPRINVGLCHLPTASIDWDFVEHCAAALLSRHGFSYYLEQALTAILLARLGAAPLSPSDYVVYPGLDVARRASAAAIHYVDDSRAYYYAFAWKQVMDRSPAPEK